MPFTYVCVDCDEKKNDFFLENVCSLGRWYGSGSEVKANRSASCLSLTVV